MTVPTEAGKLIEVRDALGGVTRYEYDKNGYKTASTDPRGNRTQTEYTADNKVSRMWDEAGRSISYRYDGAGKLSGVKNDATGSEVLYRYDASGRPAEKTDAEGNTSSSPDRDPQ